MSGYSPYFKTEKSPRENGFTWEFDNKDNFNASYNTGDAETLSSKRQATTTPGKSRGDWYEDVTQRHPV